MTSVSAHDWRLASAVPGNWTDTYVCVRCGLTTDSMDATPPACIVRQIDPRAFRRSSGPGALLFAEIKAREWTIREFAALLCYDPAYVWGVLDGDTEIDQEFANALGRVLGTSADLWLNLAEAHRTSQETP